MRTLIKLCFPLTVIIALMMTSCEKTSVAPPALSGAYSVFAWNDLGMHCLNPSYNKLVILPPYNTLMAQVVKRGDPPQVLTTGVTVSYRVINNTFSYNKGAFGGFWDNSSKLFGVTLAHDIGLKGNGLTGNMTASGNHFTVEGIPLTPYYDNNSWNPYQVAEITVKDGSGNTLAQTQCMIPTSDEMNCAKCHGANSFDDILSKHDSKHGTNFSSPASQPILCAGCHPDPALGITTGSEIYLSRAMHESHADKTGITCYDCHPGAVTKCSRSLLHTADDGNCVTCHGTMANVASTIAGGRVPWASEPACATCHTGVTDVSTGIVLYRNSEGHGNMFCPSCHGSPHAMMPSRENADNYQSVQYQGFTSKVKSIGSCGVCHDSSRGASNIGDFADAHGGTNPEHVIGCRACHTSVPTNTASWPHAYTWKNSN